MTQHMVFTIDSTRHVRVSCFPRTSCNYRSGNIRLNTELAKKPPECLEYVVVHEMAHLREPSHNSRFIALMDQYMPSWRNHRDECNAPTSALDLDVDFPKNLQVVS